MGVVETGAGDEAGGEGVDAHALWPELVGEGAAEGEHGALGGGVGERAGVAALAAGEGREVDDARAAPGFRGLDQVGRGGAGDAAHAADVERYDLGPEIVAGFRQGAAGDERAGVVDQDIEPAEKRDGLGDERVAALGRGEIGAGAAEAAAERVGLGGEGAGALGAAAVVHEYIAAGGKQVATDGEADALGAGGDEGAFAEEFLGGSG